MRSLDQLRRWYAEELRFAADIKSPALVEAFASVPREDFLGPGPWRIRSRMRPDEPPVYWTTEDADPARVYHDCLIALDERRGLNNGLPSLWGLFFDRLDLKPGERVLHLGCGTGYYSAILAELVGRDGAVTAVEHDGRLAALADAALAAWPQVTVVKADGAAYRPEPVDLIVASAGATHPLPHWLDAMKPAGRLLLPLTAGRRQGGMMLLATRRAGGFAARLVLRVWFYDFAGARDPEAKRRLEAALARGEPLSVRSLRREPHGADATCWLHGEGYCLSRLEPAA